MAKESTDEMTFEKALEILKSDVYTLPYGTVQEALRIVKEKDPNHPVLADFNRRTNEFKKENNLEEDAPDVYENNYDKIESIVSGLTFKKFKKDNKDIADILQQTEITDGDGKDEKVLDDKAKDDYLNLLFEGAKMKAEAVLIGNKSFAQMSERERAKTAKEEIKMIFFADFAQTAIASSMSRPTEKEQVVGSPEYRDYVLRQSKKAVDVFDNIIKGGKKIRVKVNSILSSCADTATHVEKYIEALKSKAKGLFGKIGNKLKKGLDDAKTGAENGFSKLAASFQDKKNKFEAMANRVSKNRYEIWKNIKGSFSDNKFKLIGNVAANAAFGYWTAAAAAGAAGTAAAPVLVPAIAAYATYHAVGSWVWPVVAEMRKINRQKKEAGEQPLKFKDALKQAWKNKMGSRKDKRSYLIGGVVNTALAGVGFTWLKDGLEAADAVNTLVDGAKDGLNTTLASSIADTRHAISLGRTGMASVAQLTDAGVAYAVAAKDPDNKEKSTEFKQAATSALIGLGFNVAFQGLGFASGRGSANEVVNAATSDQIAHENVADTLQSSSEGKSGNWFSRLFGGRSHVEVAPETPADTTAVADSTLMMPADTTAVAENVPAAEMEDDSYGLFPRTYTSEEEMGITRNEYNILVRTTEGTLKAATGDEVTLDRVYLNLEDSMEHFPDKTKEEIIYKFNRLYAFMRKAYEVGDGTLRETPSGHDYLETRFEKLNLGLSDEKMGQLVYFAQENTYASKSDLKEGLKEIFPDGLSNKDTTAIITTIHSNQRFYQYQQEMEDLIGLLGCGNKINAQQAVAINNMLDKTNEILATGKENTQLTGLSLAKDCHDDDGEWRRISRPTPTPTPEPEPEPEPTPTPTPKVPPLPVLDVEIPEDNLQIEDVTFDLKAEPLSVEPLEYPESTPEPESQQMKVRKLVADKYSQITGEEPTKQKVFSDKKAARILKRHGLGD